MEGRRHFLKRFLGLTAILGIGLHPLFTMAGSAYAKAQTLIAGAKPREAGQGLTPLDRFKTMGAVQYDEDIRNWRLEVTGNVKTPISLTYDEVLAMPTIEKEVVLVCPGFFTNHGLWKGVSMKPLLEKVQAAENVAKVIISGHNGSMTKKEEFTLAEIRSDKVFFAHSVNGVTLPEKHGYPLRVVAEGHDGDDWVKFVFKMEVI